MTAVPPKILKSALHTDKTLRFFKIDPHHLDPQRTTVRLYRKKPTDKQIPEENFDEFDPDAVKEYSHLPQRTRKYYEEMRKKGKKPLLFPWVSHFLYKGQLDVSSADVVRV